MEWEAIEKDANTELKLRKRIPTGTTKLYNSMNAFISKNPQYAKKVTDLIVELTVLN